MRCGGKGAQGELGQRGMNMRTPTPEEEIGFAPRGAPQRGNPNAAWLGTTMPSSSGSVFRSSSVELVRKTPDAGVAWLNTLELTANLRQSK